MEACNLIKNQSKTYEEVAAHFGVEAATKEHGTLVTEINQIVDQLLNQASSAQAEQIRQALPKLGVAQLQQIKAKFWQMTAMRLRQYAESGQIEAEIRHAANNALNEGNSFGLLMPTSSHSQKTLPGSSINGSVSE